MNGPWVTAAMRPSTMRTRYPVSPTSMRNVVWTKRPRRTSFSSAFTSSAKRSIMAHPSCQLHQRVDRDDAVALRFDHQRVDLGLGNGLADLGEPRQSHDGLCQRGNIAGRLAAEPGECLEPLHLADHGLRLGEIDRRQPQAAVAKNFR